MLPLVSRITREGGLREFRETPHPHSTSHWSSTRGLCSTCSPSNPRPPVFEGLPGLLGVQAESGRAAVVLEGAEGRGVGALFRAARFAFGAVSFDPTFHVVGGPESRQQLCSCFYARSNVGLVFVELGFADGGKPGFFARQGCPT